MLPSFGLFQKIPWESFYYAYMFLLTYNGPSHLGRKKPATCFVSEHELGSSCFDETNSIMPKGEKLPDE